jgi:hypothetical protein
MAANPFHGFDPYRAEKDKAARERAEWRKTFRARVRIRRGRCGAALLGDENQDLSPWLLFRWRRRADMPTIDNEALRKAAMRELALSRRKGDFLTCDASPAPSMMVVNGKPMTMRPPLSEAERKAQADRAWSDHCWKYYS